MITSLIIHPSEMRDLLDEHDKIYDKKYKIIYNVMHVYYGFISLSIIYYLYSVIF